MFHANEACDGKGTLTVKDGKMTFHVSLASKNIVNLFVGKAEDAQKDGAELLEPTTDEVTYSDGETEEVYGFDIPVEAVDEEFDLYFYTTNGLYQCFAKIIDRYKTDNKYLLLLELTSNLRRFQRREYYRLSCALEMNARSLQKEEIEAVEQNNNYLVPGLPLTRSIIVDISGGGIRFVSGQWIKQNQNILLVIRLTNEYSDETFYLPGQVIATEKHPAIEEMYIHRVKFLFRDLRDREKIVRFVFEEERRIRRKEVG